MCQPLKNKGKLCVKIEKNCVKEVRCVKIEKFRARNFCLLLYDEDKTHTQAIEKIKKDYDYAMIIHNQDKNENEEILKHHYHIVIRFKNAKWNTALAEELGITDNYIEECRDLKKALLYLIHFYDEDKYQYHIDDVIGPLKKRLEAILLNEDKNENEKVLELLEFINNSDTEISVKDFSYYCASVGKWDIFRRASLIFIKIIEQHNQKYTNQD